MREKYQAHGDLFIATFNEELQDWKPILKFGTKEARDEHLEMLKKDLGE